MRGHRREDNGDQPVARPGHPSLCSGRMINAIQPTTLQRLNLQRPRSFVSRAAVPLALLVLGAGSAWLYFWGRDLHRFTQWVAAYIFLFIGQLAFYSLACVVVLRRSDAATRIAKWATLATIVFFAIVFRAVLVPQRPYLSADLYRYVWDGHVQASGINPYRYAPGDPELESLRDEVIYPNISAEDQRWLSPYPPAAQMVFGLVSLVRPMSVTAVKAAMSTFDLIAVLLVMMVLARSGIDPARAIIFAWHPLVIFEGAHSGHIEAVFIALLMLALFAWSRERYALTGVALALATLTKFYPIVVLPAFLIATRDDAIEGAMASRRSIFSRLFNKRNLAMLTAFAVTLALAYAPYAGAGSNVFGFLRAYVQEEGFIQTGARYFLLDALRQLAPIPTAVFLVFGAACLIAVAVWQLTRIKRDALEVARAAMALIGTYLLLTTPRYAWYYVWLVPFLCFAPRLGWMYLACASALLYLVWYTPLVYPDVPLWLGASIYVPVLAMLVLQSRDRRRIPNKPPA
jgi:alpha-1,6-mannosyltransferase